MATGDSLDVLRLGEAFGVQDRLIGTTLAGRYELTSLLGRGGMGRVYRARDHRLDREVAVKVLAEDVSGDEGMSARFVREAKVLARLSHKHVLQVFDHGETDEGRLFLITELLRGQALGDVLREQMGRRLSPRATAQLLVQIATGLDRVHADGVIHRDLKPANIFVESDDGQPHVKILDFGIARRLVASTGSDTGLVGTPAYMSPEQLRAEREIDARTDLYSLGIIAYECLSGRPPFVDEVFVNLALAHMDRPPPSLAIAFPAGGLADELRVLVEELLAKLPSQRPSSAREVRTRLEAMLASGRLAGEGLEAPGEDTTKKGGVLVPTPTPQVRVLQSGGGLSSSGPIVAERRVRWWLPALGVVLAGLAGVVIFAASLRVGRGAEGVRTMVPVEPARDPGVGSPARVGLGAAPGASGAPSASGGVGAGAAPSGAAVAAPSAVASPGGAAVASQPAAPTTPKPTPAATSKPTPSPSASSRPMGSRPASPRPTPPSPTPTVAPAVASATPSPSPVAEGRIVVDARAPDGSKVDADVQVRGRAEHWKAGQEIALPVGRHVLVVRRKGEFLRVQEKPVKVEDGTRTLVPIMLE